MATIHVDDQTAAALQAQAAQRGLTVPQYLASLAQVATPPRITLEELDRLLDAEATDRPIVPGTFSRAEIYADHD
jgi:hypothetical protein